MLDDAVLPAARHLTGPSARDVLSAAVEAVGGRLGRARPCHLHYRPGRDLVVRFDSTVAWAQAPEISETLVAATTIDGPPEGTLPIEASTDEGQELRVGVWRWPHDPVLSGLREAVTPSCAAELLGDLVHGRLDLTVVVYRPTQRVVVRAVDEHGTVIYLKALAPRSVPRLVERHERLRAAGVPVPEVLRSDAERGIIAMAALEGTTVRERIKRGDGCLPPAEQYDAIFTSFAAADLPRRRRAMGRIAGALRHAAMLSTVLDAERDRIERIVAQLEPAEARAAGRPQVTIHGDLYEAQLVTGRGRGQARTITGVLDLDDAGPGDPLDDRATLLGHLLERLADPGPRRSELVHGYAASLRSAFGRGVDAAELDTAVAGVLVGLATGPFRIQRRQWGEAVGRRLALAEHLLARAGETELTVPA